MIMRILAAGLTVLAASPAASAGEADVLKVAIMSFAKDGTWTFDVTVRHDDTGWDHYADKWDILGPDGRVLATRVLLHPHETEQPFTRSLDGVVIPPGVSAVTVRAHDTVHGYGGTEVTISIPR
ncbi:hypothetical protein [Thalassobaculum sp.]|uniref:hypothetical protein n=1 Tax=Thalassobaculum sp. TaxID=2022740 RepID=UPI0032ED4033